jgi:Rps23 Pro-64 3,4-dihydroxylase Tpa1-like proline 4-hydroxylase
VSNSKKIHIFDNVFSAVERNDMFNFVLNSRYVIDGTSAHSFESIQSKPYFQSSYSNKDVDNMKFFQSKKLQPVKDVLLGYVMTRAYIFSSDNTTIHHFHTDPSDLTMIYYPNTTWNTAYGGETMFIDDEMDEIVYTTTYVPGRVIVFNSKILHKMASPSPACPIYRFVFVSNWSKDGN